MAIIGLESTYKFEASSRIALKALGIELEQGHDFDAYRELVAEGRPDHRVGDPFDTKLHDIGKDNGLWIVGRDRHGRVMHTQAFRLLSTGTQTVANYFRSHFRGFAPSGIDIDFERSRYRAGPGAKRMMGRVVYSGEFWIGGIPRQYRGTGLSEILGRYVFLTALRHFHADHVVGFMTRPVSHKGFSLRMGYIHAEPQALRWYVNGERDPLECVMVYMGEEDMRYVLDLPNSEMETLAA